MEILNLKIESRFLKVALPLTIKEITSNKLRSFITSFGIFLGVASMLAMVSVMRGMNENVSDFSNKSGGSKTIKVNSIKAESLEEEISFSRSPGLTILDAEMTLKNVEDLSHIVSYIPIGWKPIRSSGLEKWANMNAIGPKYFSSFNVKISDGRDFVNDDFLKEKKVCTIGMMIKKRLLKDKPWKDKFINYNGVNLKIIGLTGETRRDWDSWRVFFPVQIYWSYVNAKNENVSELTFVAKHQAKIKPIVSKIHNYIKARHRGIEDFEVIAAMDLIEQEQKNSNIIKLITGIIAGISLIVGAIGITNIMLAAIGDRIREIGVLKALGAKNKDIFFQFLSESLLLSLIGGVLGSIVGSVLTFLPKDSLPWVPSLLVSDYILAVIIAGLMGVFAGLFPAIYAAKKSPIEALGHY